MVLLYGFFNLIGFGCPIKFLTGISCAGCGMTRAWICLIHLDIKGAYYYHPLFILPMVYLFIFLFQERISRKIFKFLVVIGVVIFATVYILRLLNPDDIVVNINIKEGFIYKVYQFILQGGS